MAPSRLQLPQRARRLCEVCTGDRQITELVSAGADTASLAPRPASSLSSRITGLDAGLAKRPQRPPSAAADALSTARLPSAPAATGARPTVTVTATHRASSAAPLALARPAGSNGSLAPQQKQQQPPAPARAPSVYCRGHCNRQLQAQKNCRGPGRISFQDSPVQFLSFFSFSS